MQAKAAEESGDHTAATEYRRKVRQWNITGIIVGILVYSVCAIIIIISIGVAVYFRILSDRLNDMY